MSKICINCGAELEDCDLFCGNCGTKQPEVPSHCVNCGNELPQKAKFCPQCGTSVGGTAMTASPALVETTKLGDSLIEQPDADTIKITVKGVTFNMKLVKGGVMNDGFTDLSDYYLGETVVTQELWQMVMGDNPSEDNSDLQLPVTNLNSSQCLAFMLKLKKITGKEFSLPTIYQWHFAYSGGNKSKDYKYAGGNNLNKVAWTKGNSGGKLHPVAQLYPNELGLYDMEGNVYEYVEGKYRSSCSYRLNPSGGEEESFVSSSAQNESWEKKQDKAFLGIRLAINLPVAPNMAEERQKSLEQPKDYIWDEKVVDVILEKHEGEWILFDHAGNVINKKGYEYVCDFCEGMARVIKDDKRGFINRQGREVISCKYEKAKDFCEGMSRVMQKGKYGFIDKLGNLSVPCKYEDANDFCEGLARVKYKGKYGYVDKEGNEVIACKFKDKVLPPYSGDFHNGLAAAQDNKGKYIYINKLGEEVITCKYDKVSDFNEGMACVGKTIPDSMGLLHYYGFIDLEGKEVVPCNKYDSHTHFCNDIATVCDAKSQKYGAIDKRGKEVIPFKYDMIYDFREEGFAIAKKNGKYGLIDKKGKEVIPCKYSNLDLHDGLFMIEKNEQYGYMDLNGKEVIPCKYEDAYDFNDGVALVSLPGQDYGFIDKAGKLIVPCKYEYDEDLEYDNEDEEPIFRCGLALISRDEKYFLFDKKGKKLLEFNTDYEVCRLDNMIALRLSDE